MFWFGVEHSGFCSVMRSWDKIQNGNNSSIINMIRLYDKFRLFDINY